MVSDREGGGVARIADDRILPIEGVGNLPTSFRFDRDYVKAILLDVAHVLPLEYNLLSLKMLADRGHKYVGQKKGSGVTPAKRFWFLGRRTE